MLHRLFGAPQNELETLPIKHGFQCIEQGDTPDKVFLDVGSPWAVSLVLRSSTTMDSSAFLALVPHASLALQASSESHSASSSKDFPES